MKRETLLLGIVALLVLLNGAILFFFLGRDENHRPPPHDKIIVETLQFDKAQQAQFDQLKQDHHSRVKAIDDIFDKNMEKYFALLQTDTANLNLKDSIDSVMAFLEREKIRITYAHFEDLKKLCREDQQEKFNAFLPQLVKFIMRPNPPKKEPPERRN